MSKIDAAVKLATACGNWDAMQESMKNGYVPTLRADYGERDFRDAVRRIRKACRDNGFKYYHGGKVYGK